jgi:hypothetical protein
VPQEAPAQVVVQPLAQKVWTTILLKPLGLDERVTP